MSAAEPTPFKVWNKETMTRESADSISAESAKAAAESWAHKQAYDGYGADTDGCMVLVESETGTVQAFRMVQDISFSAYELKWPKRVRP